MADVTSCETLYIAEPLFGKKETLRESRQVFELAEAQIPGLVNLVFYLQTGFTSARILLLINQWS